MRVLIADDELISLSLLENSLQKWGYETVTCKNGNEAWEILQKDDAPNLVILDWMMPGMDGIDVCSRVRSKNNAAYVYIILLTGRGSREDVIKGLEAGADDYIVKPFNPEELRYRIKIGQRIIELERRILKLANTDCLTGLLNRGAFMERMETELNRSKRQKQSLGIIILDLDHFKNVNDSYGHQSGDRVLQEISRSITKACRTYDLIGRYGGEEFIVCLPGANIGVAALTAERIRQAIEKDSIFLPELMKYISITASCGVSSLPEGSDESLDFLISQADNALYQAKNDGRNRICMSQ